MQSRQNASSIAGRYFVLFCYAILALACGDTSGGGGGRGTATTASVDCSDLSLQQTQAAIGDFVTIIGLVEVDESTVLSIEGPATTVEVGVGQLNGADAFFATPFHPDLAGDAGTVLISTMLDGERCEIADLSVSALPPAAESVADDTVALLEAVAIQLNQTFDFDPGSFDAATTTSPYELTQAILYFTLLDDNAPSSLAMLQVRLDALSSAERVLVGRLFLQFGLPDLLQNILSTYSGVVIETEDPPLVMAAISAGLPTTLDASGVRVAATTTGIACPPISSGLVRRASIVSAEDLSSAMLLTQEARASLENPDQSPLAAAVLAIASAVSPAVGVSSLVLNAGLFLRSSAAGDVATLLPSTLTDVRMELTVNPINEDQLDLAANAIPSWRAQADAASQGLNLTSRIVEGAILATGVLKVPDQLAPPLELLGVVTGEILSETAGEETSCVNIPPAFWTDLNVTDRRWLLDDPTVLGTSIELDDPNLIIPTQTGASRILIDLEPDLFPCFDDCERDADANVEILAKEVVFVRAVVGADSENAEVELQASILNTSAPELFDVTVGPGASLISVDRDGAQFTILVQGNGDRDLFPIEVELVSTSSTLPPNSSAPNAIALITLDVNVAIRQVAPSMDACIPVDREVLLLAEVTGVEPGADLVTFMAEAGLQLTPAGANQVSVSASAPGRFIVTATSNTDPTAFDEFEVVVSNCDVTLSVFGRATARLDANGSCTPGAPQADPMEAESEIGVLSDPPSGVLRHDEDWTAGDSWQPGLTLQAQITTTITGTGGACSESSVNESAMVLGELSSEAESGTLQFNLDMQIAGECAIGNTETGEIQCGFGTPELLTLSTFVIDVNEDTAGAWTFSAELDCSYPDLIGGFLLPNLLIIAATTDSSGLNVPITNFLSFDDAVSFGSLAGQLCYDSTGPIDVEVNFDLPVPSAGNEYSFAVLVSHTPFLAPSEPLDPAFTGPFETTGGILGEVSLLPSSN